MKLRKIELGLEGDEFWPKLPIVHVPGVSDAVQIPEGSSQEEAENVIKSWEKAAILKVTPADGGALIGFWASSDACQYLNVSVETTKEGLFAMRIGSGDVDFFVVPQNHKTNYILKFIELVGINDPKYSDIALY